MEIVEGFVAREPGMWYQGLEIHGQCAVEAPGVCFNRCKHVGHGENYGIIVRGEGSVVCRDGQMTGDYRGAAIAFDNWVAERMRFHHLTVDGLKLGSHTRAQFCCFYDFSHEEGGHQDCIQMQNGVVEAYVLNNVFNVPGASTALFLSPDLGPSTDGPVLVQGNYLNGGNYTIEVEDGRHTFSVGNMVFRGNRFGRDHRFGPVQANAPVTWEDNAYYDDKSPIEL